MSTVEKSWNKEFPLPHPPRLLRLQLKLKRLKTDTKEWNINVFGKIQDRLKAASAILQEREVIHQLSPNTDSALQLETARQDC